METTHKRETECIAIKDSPYFTKGEKVILVTHLYEEDTEIRSEMWGIFKNGEHSGYL